jgi:L-Ala-D/L-Glu epimerase
MIRIAIDARPLSIPFNTAFSHASATRTSTHTVWVEARTRDGKVGYGEGCPREYVTAETLEGALSFIATYRTEWLATVHDVETMANWCARHSAAIEANPAAWTAVELAMLDLFGKIEGKSVEALLGLPPIGGKFRYTAVLGDMSPKNFTGQLARYVQAGFMAFKIKLSGDAAHDLAKVRALKDAGVLPAAVRADANNLWRDANQAIRALSALDYRFFAIEEPLHAGDYEGMGRIAAALETRIILDESILRAEQLRQLTGPNGHWIVNVRVSKMGGLLRSLQFIEAARKGRLPVVVGAHVGETSLLTRAALTVASHASDLLIAQEGAFGTHLLAEDVTRQPIMFGPGGWLDATRQGIGTLPGLGIDVSNLPPVLSS